MPHFQVRYGRGGTLPIAIDITVPVKWKPTLHWRVFAAIKPHVMIPRRLTRSVRFSDEHLPHAAEDTCCTHGACAGGLRADGSVLLQRAYTMHESPHTVHVQQPRRDSPPTGGCGDAGGAQGLGFQQEPAACSMAPSAATGVAGGSVIAGKLAEILHGSAPPAEAARLMVRRCLTAVSHPLQEVARKMRSRPPSHWAQQPRRLDGVNSPYYAPLAEVPAKPPLQSAAPGAAACTSEAMTAKLEALVQQAYSITSSQQPTEDEKPMEEQRPMIIPAVALDAAAQQRARALGMRSLITVAAVLLVGACCLFMAAQGLVGVFGASACILVLAGAATVAEAASYLQFRQR